MARFQLRFRSRICSGMMFGLIFVTACALGSSHAADPAYPIQPGRLELLVDQSLIDELSEAAPRVHRPTPGEVALTCDQPWEGNTSAYFTVLFDGEKYRAYYRGSHYDTKTRKVTHPEVTCYAESEDGVRWTKPNLGLYEFEGSKDNNIVWNGIGTHCFTPFLDSRPDCPPEAKFKAISRGRPQAPKGLYAFQSPDGIHWKLMQEKPVITNGAFDSQNLAFWDAEIGKYREYHRSFIGGVRSIVTGVSDDFIHWSDPKPLAYVGAPKEHLYTNAILPHPRARHILLGFPTRYFPKRGSQVEPLLMASRDGETFYRYQEELIPVTAPQDRMGNRSNYMAWGLTPVQGNDRLEAVYATEAYYEGKDNRLRRFLFVKDRYAAIHSTQRGEALTKPLLWKGEQLTLNHVTEGALRVEVQDESGEAIAGYALEQCVPLIGDADAAVVRWENQAGEKTMKPLVGKKIRLRVVLEQSDWFGFRAK